MGRKPSAKPLGIVAEIMAEPIKRTSGRGWFDRLKEGAAKDDLRDLHRRKKAGEMEIDRMIVDALWMGDIDGT